MRTLGLFFFAACGFGMLLCGCGGTSVQKPMAPAASPLAGNWLLVGPMPTDQVIAGSGFRLAMTFDVIGNNIVAGGFGSNFCDNIESSFGFGSVVTGAVATDGNFTLATSTNGPLATVSIKGTLPKASGESWPGAYAVSLTSPLAQCDANLSGTFTATSFPLVSGVYVGTGSTQTTVNGVSTVTPLTFQVTLQQGGMITSPVNGETSTIFSNAVLIGSIRVQGSPCFTSGATGSTPPSAVEGNRVGMTFTMDDGSTLTILGSLTDATETRMTTNVAIAIGGQCGTPPAFYQLPELDRQS